ncbi:MAG: GntR family transcriptional regulator, partial [Spirochaetales bacterium]|nr:GntR family transcriptional regulator [Spirochaetales bacterium]
MDIKNRSLKAVIYDKILNRIVSNEFATDDLLVESQLVKMFDVSRAPVREALIELCSANIIRNIPRAGYQIIRISEKDLRDGLQFRLMLEIEGL